MAVGVGVIPVGAGAVAHFELVAIALARPDGKARMPVHGVGDVQAMPVHGARLVQSVDEIDADFLAALQAQDRPQVAVGQRLHACRIPFQHARLIGPHGCGAPRAQRNTARKSDQFQSNVWFKGIASALHSGCGLGLRQASQQCRSAHADAVHEAAAGEEFVVRHVTVSRAQW